MRLLFVHSPYLGPASWQPTADELSAMGYAVHVPDLRESIRRESCAASFIAAARVALGVPADRVILVGHSRAGPLLPAIAHGGHASVAALLYVDSALPHPDRSWTDEATPERVAEMRMLSSNGVLPRWTDWWGDSLIAELIQDPVMRERFIAELPNVPTRFLDDRMPDLDWQGPAGYLQLSASYAAFAQAAQVAGWQVERCALDHLAIFTEPSEVASRIHGLLIQLGANAGKHRT